MLFSYFSCFLSFLLYVKIADPFCVSEGTATELLEKANLNEIAPKRYFEQYNYPLANNQTKSSTCSMAAAVKTTAVQGWRWIPLIMGGGRGAVGVTSALAVVLVVVSTEQ